MIRRTLIIVSTPVLLTSACSSGSAVAEELNDREFWATAVLENSEPRPLVENTRISLRFWPDGRLSVGTGCNSIGADSFKVDSDRLVLSDSGMTQMGCDPERHEQEDFIQRFLDAKPTVTLSGTDLELGTDSIVVQFVDASVANPDRELIGTRWQVGGFDDGQVATSFNVARPAELTFLAGNVSGFDGCAEFSAAVKIGPRTLQIFAEAGADFLPPPFSDLECEPTEYARTVRNVLGGDSIYEIDGDRLRIERDGMAITARAVE